MQGLPFAEIRLDRMRLNEADIALLFSRHPRLIATYRPGRRTAEARRLATLRAAIAAGAAYVDIELETKASYKRTIVRAAHNSRCQVIVSHHDFMRTPPRRDLEAIRDRCFASGADIAKIACRVRSPRDNARLLGLLDDARETAGGQVPYEELARLIRRVADA
jgi:3-dehydroquinate dehydratase-1